MTRRTFIRDGMIALSAPLVAGVPGRLYGMPASVHPRDLSDLDKFKLPLAKAKVPTELWDNLAKVAKLWENVLTDDSESVAFHGDPGAYLGSIGLDTSDRTLASESAVLLQAVTDPEVKAALAQSDYASVFTKLINTGVFTPTDPSFLQSQIESVFRENSDEIQASIAAIQPYVNTPKQLALLASIDSNDVVLSDDDIVSLGQVLTNQIGTSAQPACAPGICAATVVLAIAVTVVAYVSVAIAATVAIVVGVTVSAAATVAVTASTNGHKPNNVGAGNGLISQSPFAGEYVKLDPAAMRNAERAVRLAALTDDAGLQVYAAKQAIALEVQAVLTAMRNVSLLPVSQEVLPKVIDLITRYSWKCLGLDAVGSTG